MRKGRESGYNFWNDHNVLSFDMVVIRTSIHTGRGELSPPDAAAELSTIPKQTARAINLAETRGRVTVMLHEAMTKGVDVSCILEECGLGLRSWQNVVDDLQITLPFFKIPLDLWTPQSTRTLWFSEPLEHRTLSDAAEDDDPQDDDDPDDVDYDVSIGWSPGTEAPKEIYLERLRLVRSVSYTAELPNQSFRLTPVPPWNSRIDHPNPWMATPAFLRNFPEEVQRRRTHSPYWVADSR